MSLAHPVIHPLLGAMVAEVMFPGPTTPYLWQLGNLPDGTLRSGELALPLSSCNSWGAGPTSCLDSTAVLTQVAGPQVSQHQEQEC